MIDGRLGNEMVPLTRYESGCLMAIKKLNQLKFTPNDVWPKVKKPTVAFRRLVDKGYLQRTFEGDTVFHQVVKSTIQTSMTIQKNEIFSNYSPY